jgi:hypothetical protein
MYCNCKISIFIANNYICTGNHTNSIFAKCTEKHVASITAANAFFIFPIMLVIINDVQSNKGFHRNTFGSMYDKKIYSERTQTCVNERQLQE